MVSWCEGAHSLKVKAKVNIRAFEDEKYREVAMEVEWMYGCRQKLSGR
jgi:hypothetical protein